MAQTYRKARKFVNCTLSFEKYAVLQERAKEAGRTPTAYAQIHTETDHPHLYLLISGNKIETSRKVRVSKQRFTIIKQKLERYQKRHYPFLSRSTRLSPTKAQKTLTSDQTAIREQVLLYLDRAETMKVFGSGRNMALPTRKYY